MIVVSTRVLFGDIKRTLPQRTLTCSRGRATESSCFLIRSCGRRGGEVNLDVPGGTNPAYQALLKESPLGV